MPVVLTEQPADGAIFFASDKANFKATIDTVDANKIHKLITQVYQETPEKALSGESSRRISAATEVTSLEIMNIAKDALSDFVPDLDKNDDFIPDPTFEATVFLRYTEVILEQGVQTPVPITYDSNKIKVINAVAQDYQDPTIGSAIFILTDKKKVVIYKDAFDWIRRFSPTGGGATATVLFQLKDGTTASKTITGTNGLFPTGPAQLLNGEVYSNLAYSYSVTFSSGFPNRVDYIIKDPCCPANQRIDIYFREQKGSWGVMHFKCPKERIRREYADIERQGYFGNDTATYFKSFGPQLKSYRSWMQASLELVDMVDQSNIEYYRAFANAKQYRAVYRFSEYRKEELLAPFIPTVSDFEFSSRELTNLKFSGVYPDLNVG